MTNRLAQETSPYLLQHAKNPVDWFAWGDEAFSRARAEDKPILLSIGYSACHWCHVMAHESFENEATARLMNENFINIKVDREERPDIDHVYMEAVQAMTGSGGWPLTVFLTPERKPFYGGTYFPPEDRPNFPGFSRVLASVAEAYHKRRSSVDQTTCQIEEMLSNASKGAAVAEPLTENILKQAYLGLQRSFDKQNGGFGGAPKFPHPLTLEFLLRYYTRFKEKPALEMVEKTLVRMAGGGIYDQIGGGFHRYATDKEWLVPHFEKMLYDNALLSRVYLQAFLVTGNKFYASIVEETLDYVLREMRAPSGGFYSTLDADSEGQEGKYYLWTLAEMEGVLGSHMAQKAADYFGVSAEGNFERSNILHRSGHQEDADIIKKARIALLEKRDQRVKPGRDEKVLASWNGMMLTSLALAACILQREDYKSAAISNGAFILDRMVSGGKLKHTYKDGQLKINGFLDDYALVIEGLLALHQATLEGKWLKAAVELTQTMVSQFSDIESGILYDTPEQTELFVRPRNEFDGAVPSGTSASSLVLLKMALLTGDKQYRDLALKQLGLIKQNMGQMPLGYSQWLCDLDFYLSTPKEVVIIGRKNDSCTQEFLHAFCSRWSPNAVFSALDPDDPDPIKSLPLFANREMVNGQATAYLCQNYVCKTPVTAAAALEKQLEED